MATAQQFTTFQAPGRAGSPVECKEQYENFIGGHWVAPIDGEYRVNLTPATGQPICEVAHSGPQDIELALAADHFRYFADVIRAEEGRISEIDKDTVAYHFSEPLGVVGQIIPFNFPLLMAAWKMAPALAAGNCAIVKPASPTPWSILKFAEIVADIIPPGVLNIVN